MKELGIGILVVAVLAGLGWLFTENSYRLSQRYAPRFEQVRRQTFEQSRAFTEGNARELNSIRRDYETTDDPVRRAALRGTALHIIDGIDVMTLPPDLRRFANALENSQ